MIYNEALKSAYDLTGSELFKPAPTPFKPIPTTSDYEVGYIARTFAKKINEDVVIEVSTTDEISPLYIAASLQWKITGPKDDRYSGKIVEDMGVVNYNRAEISRVLKENSINLTKALPNLLEFWRGY